MEELFGIKFFWFKFILVLGIPMILFGYLPKWLKRLEYWMSSSSMQRGKCKRCNGEWKWIRQNGLCDDCNDEVENQKYNNPLAKYPGQPGWGEDDEDL